MLNKKNKNGAGKILSIYWFAILLITAIGVFLMVYSFHKTPYDVRKAESRILMNQLADCVSYEGIINAEIISEGSAKENPGFFEKCHLNFKPDEEEYYTEINFYPLERLENPLTTIREGNKNLAAACIIQKETEKEYEKLTKCSEESFYSVDNANNQYIIKILTAVRKSGQNVKL